MSAQPYKIIVTNSLTKAVTGTGDLVSDGILNPLDFEPLVRLHANHHLNTLLSDPVQLSNGNLIINAKDAYGEKIWYSSQMEGDIDDYS